MMTTMVSRRYILCLQSDSWEKTFMKTRSSLEDAIIKGGELSTEVFIAVVGMPTSLSAPTQPTPTDKQPLGNVSWIDLTQEGFKFEDLIGLFENTASDVGIDSKNIAADIHGLADKLPTAGFHLDIIWSVSENTALSIEEHIALFGALQRLKTWHNAHLLVTPVEGSVYNASIEPWLTYLRGEVRCLSEPEDAGSLLDWDLIWRGDLRFSDGKGVAAVVLPGFSLIKTHVEEPLMTVDETDGDAEEVDEGTSPYHNALQQYDDFKAFAAFDRTLDVIHIVNQADVPGCLVSSQKFILDVMPGDRLPRSSEFFKWLVSEGRDEGVAVLARLAGTQATHSALINNVGGGDAKLKTEEWRKNLHQVPNVEVKGQPYALHLLLHGDQDGRCIARVMRTPQEMDASIHVKIASSQIEFDDENGSVMSALKDLPVFDGTHLQQMEEEISELQDEALKSFLGGKGAKISVDELRELMAAVRKEYMTGMETKNYTGTLEQTIDGSTDTQQATLTNVKTELDQSPSEWLERLVIHHKESIEKKMKRYKSSDMMLGGMMVTKCKDNTIRLDAAEFLKHFASDGQTAILEEAMSPIGVINGEVLKSQDHAQNHDWKTLKTLIEDKPFNEIMKYRYPGIRYCLEVNKAQKLDDHFVKMQQKLVWNETASTCTMEQAASPATMEIRTSSTKPTGTTDERVKGHTKRKLSDSASKRKAGRGTKRKNEDGESSSQASKRRFINTETDKRTFAKPSSSQVLKKTHSVDNNTLTVRSSPRRKPATKSPSSSSSDRRRSTSSKVTTTTIGAAAAGGSDRRSSRGSSSSSVTTSSVSGGRERKGSRKQRHTEILQGIVDKLLHGKGIAKDHIIYRQCSLRLFNQTKDFVKALPPKSYTSLTKEMQSIAEGQVDFCITFEMKLLAAKEKNL